MMSHVTDTAQIEGEDYLIGGSHGPRRAFRHTKLLYVGLRRSGDIAVVDMSALARDSLE